MVNQRGGMLSKIFIIPVGVALMVGFFFLGYFVGRYQSRPVAERTLPPLPEISAPQAPKQEEFTFYKTLTEKEHKSVSIELKPGKEGLQSAGGTAGGAEEKIEIKLARPGGGQSEPEKKADTKPDRPDINGPGQPPKPDTVKKAEQAPPQNLRYTIQIASYNERDMAEDEVKRMKKRGYAAFIVATELPDKGTWYRVRLGSFSSKQAAERLLNELKTKEGLSPFITIE